MVPPTLAAKVAGEGLKMFPVGVSTKAGGKKLFLAIAGLAVFLMIGGLPSAYACRIGDMQVSGVPSPLSCQKINAIQAQPVPVLSNQDCPAGSIEIDAIGAMDTCHKTINGHQEVVLKAGDRCPPGNERFIDSEGSAACRLRTPVKDAEDGATNGY